MTDADLTAGSAGDGPARTRQVTDPSDAFQALGNEVRVAILKTMLTHLDDDTKRVPFTTLFEASSVDTTAGFAYHLSELVGPFLEKDDDGYALTHAGRKIARAVEAGVYTDRTTQSPVPVDDPCPFCQATSLEATAEDNVVTIACAACERTVLRMDVPPTGFAAHGDGLPDAIDRHHRHRIASLGDGVCPECSGEVDADVTAFRPDEVTAVEDWPEGAPEPVQVAFECHQCGYDLRCPVALTLLEHPAIVSFYRDHDDSVRERPLWNVGREWSETALSLDPVAVRVAVTIDEETLECYVDEACEVVTTRRIVDDDSEAASGGADPTAASEHPPEADAA